MKQTNSPMTPNKSDSVCDCIYGDGACEKHSDSEELIRFVVLQATLTGSKYTDGEISKEQYKKKVAEYVSTLTAHIQALGEDIIGEDEILSNLPGSSMILRMQDIIKLARNDERMNQRRRLAQYLGDKQDEE